jgi:hypothetical protein
MALSAVVFVRSMLRRNFIARQPKAEASELEKGKSGIGCVGPEDTRKNGKKGSNEGLRAN